MNYKKGGRRKNYSSRKNKSNKNTLPENMSGKQDNKKRQRKEITGSDDQLSPSARASAPKKMIQQTCWDDSPTHRLRSASWENIIQPTPGAPASNLRSSSNLFQNQGNTGTVHPTLSNQHSDQFVPEYMKASGQGRHGHDQAKASQNKNKEENKVPPQNGEISLSDVMCKLEKLEGLSTMVQKIDDMAEDLKVLRDIKETMAEMRQDLSEVQDKVQHLEDKVSTLEEKAQNNEHSHQLLAKEITDMKSQINVQGVNQSPASVMEWGFLKMEAALRRQNLIIEGVKESHTERENTAYNQVHSFIRNTLGIKGVEVDMAYRLGQPRRGSSNPRPILVRFTRLGDRMEVWAAKTRLSNQANNVHTIKEDLPAQLRPVQASLLRVAQIAKKNPDKYTNISVKDFKLHLNGQTYGVEDLESLPRDLRPSFTSTPGNVQVVVFFGKDSRFSNHHPSAFTVGERGYSTVEQYLAYHRAILADREDLGVRVMASAHPLEAKRVLNILGASLDQEAWEEQRKDILFTGLMAKFSQNPELREYLLSSTNRQLGEASTNRTWGIGMTLADKNRFNTRFWRGGNLQGKTLMEVRDRLQPEIPPQMEMDNPVDTGGNIEVQTTNAKQTKAVTTENTA